MNPTSPAPRTAWMDVRPLELPPLPADTRADVCIVGAGIAGLTAYLLAKQGQRVIVLQQ